MRIRPRARTRCGRARGDSRPRTAAAARRGRRTRLPLRRSARECPARRAAALYRGPRAQLLAARAAREIRVRLLRRDATHRSFGPHLFIQPRPVERNRRLRIGLQVGRLAALVIRVEDEAPGVEPMQQHDAHGGTARVAIGSRERQRRMVGRRVPRRASEGPFEIARWDPRRRFPWRRSCARTGTPVKVLAGGLSPLHEEWIPERGARQARRDERAILNICERGATPPAGMPRPEGTPHAAETGH